MGWDIKGWLFGRQPKDNTKKILKEMRNDRNELNKQLKAERRAGQRRQREFDARTAQLSQGIQDLQIQNLQQAASFQDAYDQQAAAFASQTSALQDAMAQQAAASAEQARQLQIQIAEQRIEAAEQRRISANLRRASVPEAQAGAMGPTTTEGSLDGTRRRRDNELSELSIVSNAQNTSPLAKAGLQIA